MTLGHIVLGLSAVSAQSLYLALAIIICGYGLFKSNISCLLGELYPAQDSRREGGFCCCTPPANVGSILAPIACGLAAERYGWHVGFALAGIGMFAGPAIFLLGGRHFRHTRGVNAPLMRAKSPGLPHWGWLLAALLASPLFFTPLFVHDWAGYFRAGMRGGGGAGGAHYAAWTRPAPGLWQIVVLMLLGTLFWASPSRRQLHQPVYRSLRRSAGSAGRCRPRCSSRLTPAR